MQALLVLFVLPVLVGVAAELLFRDTTRATLVATAFSPLLIFVCLRSLDPGGTWNWLATLLFSPLAIALALATVLFCFGRSQIPKRHHPEQRKERGFASPM